MQPQKQLPSNIHQAKEYAKQSVRHLLKRGYTCERCDQEAYSSYSGPKDAGYILSHGKITIENRHVSPTEKWTFSFRQLVKELDHPVQEMLF
jgi:hypothetical protein